jgi:superfamily II DNA/RNA helicase
MPKEIADYVHRIGRTGRCGKTGIATTFINKNSPEEVLLDLKYLLIEAKQRVPLVLQTLSGPDDAIVEVIALDSTADATTFTLSFFFLLILGWRTTWLHVLRRFGSSY